MEKTVKASIRGIFIILIFLAPRLSAQNSIPEYLKGYEQVWKNESPKAAALKWFSEAKFGMFVHFSPVSQYDDPREDCFKADAEWRKIHSASHNLDRFAYKQYTADRFNIEVAPGMQDLMKSFNPTNFDAEFIADLAVQAGMKYINFTVRHVMGRLFMFDTSVSEWNSMRTCNRDFVRELSEACEKRNLGLFLYVMPPFDLAQDNIKQMLKELLTNYGSVAGIWFDGIWQAYNRPQAFKEVANLYRFINDIQPQCLISFKTGFTGDEDFLSPEWHQLKFNEKGLPVLPHFPPNPDTEMVMMRKGEKNDIWVQQSFNQVWEHELRLKPIELSTTMIKGNRWFHYEKGIHKTVDEVIMQFDIAKENNANLLLNVAPKGDGSLHPDDVKVLRQLKSY